MVYRARAQSPDDWRQTRTFFIIYTWQGLRSSTDTRQKKARNFPASAILKVKTGFFPVRVYQNGKPQPMPRPSPPKPMPPKNGHPKPIPMPPKPIPMPQKPIPMPPKPHPMPPKPRPPKPPPNHAVAGSVIIAAATIAAPAATSFLNMLLPYLLHSVDSKTCPLTLSAI